MVRQTQHKMVSALEASQLNGSSEFSHHDACPDCGSSDGLAVYTDEHTYCFVCHAWTPGNGSKQSPKLNTTMNYVGSATRLNKRNISEKTCEKFKIYRDGETLRFYYHNADGQVFGAKTRSKSKVFSYEGETDGSFLVNIYGDLKVSELQLLKASLMRRHVLRSHQLGQWYRFHLAQLQQRSRFRRIYNFFRVMTKSSSSLITMKQA